MHGNKIEVGIIGAGAISTTLHLPLLSCISDISIKYIADIINPQELGKIYKIQSVKIEDVSSLPDCDLVVLATPVGVREKYFQEFSKRKVPIFSEKPFALSHVMHKNFLEMSNRVTCNYAKVYYNSTIQLKNIIKSGIFGNLKRISVAEGGIVGKTNRGKDSYQSDVNLSGGGVIMEASCHTLSQFTSIFSNITVKESNVVWEDNYDVEANVKFDISDKTPFVMDYTITLIRPVNVGTTLFFDNCKISFNHAIPDSELVVTSYDNKNRFVLNKETRFARTANQAYYLKWKSFLDSIRSGNSIDVEHETSIKTTQLIDDIYKKAERK